MKFSIDIDCLCTYGAINEKNLKFKCLIKTQGVRIFEQIRNGLRTTF